MKNVADFWFRGQVWTIMSLDDHGEYETGHAFQCVFVCMCMRGGVCMIYGVEDSEYIPNTLPVVD